MLGKKKKPNKKARAAIRKAKIAAGVAPVKTPKKKKQVSLPEFAPVERQSPFVPHTKGYFTGGGIVRPLTFLLSAGWQLSTADRPDPKEYRVAEMKSVPQPESTVKLLWFVLRDEKQAELRASAQRIRQKIRDEDHRAIAAKDLRLLIAKNISNGQPLLAMRKIA
jgi:hypothetical protein